ncbi:MAG TPA: hypothetical protein VMU83_16680 [Hanamia sp.]|nr:hypothetical protein [Hanamia sp.]
MNQKQIWILFTVLALIILMAASCKKVKSFMNNAEITGIDPRMCPTPCCGGYEITIDNAANPNDKTNYFVIQFPSDFQLGNNPIFPIKVKIDWKLDTLQCSGNYIDILRIALR